MSRKKEPAPAKKLAAAVKPIPGKERSAVSHYLYLAIMIFVTAGIYAGSLSNGFTNWDDLEYVVNNSLIRSLDLPRIFTSFLMGNYHPLTVLLLAMEYREFAAADASGYHMVSLLLHLVNAGLVYGVVFRLTQSRLASFITALLFAIHPMHVESVAWVSAQKDLLYTFFYLAALYGYLEFTRERKWFWMLACLLAFGASNLAKAQAVTLPVVLLLADWYITMKITWKQVIAKVPFFIISVVTGLVAIQAQKESDSIQDIEARSFLVQVVYASFAFVQYLVKLFLPVNLTAYYAYPENPDGSYPWFIFTGLPVIAATGYLLYRLRYTHRYLLFGMGFFLANIFLVLQLLPVGGAMMADRYTYLSATGIFFIAGIAVDRWITDRQAYRIPVMVTFTCWLVILGITAMNRTAIWENSETLWSDVIKKNDRIPLAHNNLGSYYQKRNEYDRAKPHFDAALRLQPDFANALINRCDYFRASNQVDSALMDGNQAIRLEPLSVSAHQNRGIAYCLANKFDSAMADFRFVIQHDPRNAQAFNNLGNLYMMLQQPDSAIKNYDRALVADPAFQDVRTNRGKAHVFMGNYELAVQDLTADIALHPSNPNNYFFRMQAYARLGKIPEAKEDARKAMALGFQIPSEYRAVFDSLP